MPGYPFAKKADRRVVIDNGTDTMAITYTLDPGPRMRFGPAAITGLEGLDPDLCPKPHPVASR